MTDHQAELRKAYLLTSLSHNTKAYLLRWADGDPLTGTPWEVQLDAKTRCFVGRAASGYYGLTKLGETLAAMCRPVPWVVQVRGGFGHAWTFLVDARGNAVLNLGSLDPYDFQALRVAELMTRVDLSEAKAYI